VYTVRDIHMVELDASGVVYYLSGTPDREVFIYFVVSFCDSLVVGPDGHRYGNTTNPCLTNLDTIWNVDGSPAPPMRYGRTERPAAVARRQPRKGRITNFGRITKYVLDAVKIYIPVWMERTPQEWEKDNVGIIRLPR
jgi:hypothetical protein